MDYWFDSEISRKLYEEALNVASHDLNVLILGETGAGKEVIADLIRRNSERKDAPYVKVNCAAIPETLIESELFGYEKGAFTGALQRQIGKLEAANGGIILLDEIGDMPIMLQPRLLRVTDGYGFARIGSNEELKVDVRFISSTHLDIEKAITENRFRSDLYYRLASTVIKIPPLRERQDELLILANKLLDKKKEEIGVSVFKLSEGAKLAIRNYDWPGNFRELENKITAGLLSAKGFEITAADMFASAKAERRKAKPGDLDDLNLRKLEQDAVLEALRRTDYNQKDAAKLLRISARALNYKIKLWGLTHPSWPANK